MKGGSRVPQMPGKRFLLGYHGTAGSLDLTAGCKQGIPRHTGMVEQGSKRRHLDHTAVADTGVVSSGATAVVVGPKAGGKQELVLGVRWPQRSLRCLAPVLGETLRPRSLQQPIRGSGISPGSE